MITVIPLRFLPGSNWIQIRELSGSDEQSVAGIRSIDAISLLDRIMQKHNGNISATYPSCLPVADRDRMLTAVFINTYGSKVETTVSCNSCSSKFDISFLLEEWVKDLSTGRPGQMNGDHTFILYETPEGMKFRLPTGADEMDVMGLPPSQAEAELLKKCIQEGTENHNTSDLQEKMQEVAPLADSEFEAQMRWT